MANWLIAGLGNPGTQYQHTRHNVGFWWLDQLAEQLGVTLNVENKYQSRFIRQPYLQHELFLLKPLTFMNNSGQSVAKLVHFYKIALTNILIIHDELDLPTGTARLKYGGGHGGHNGLSDIIAKLGINSFYRCRIGIGRPEKNQQAINHVLNKPSHADKDLILSSIDNALQILPDLLSGDLAKAMNWLHSQDRKHHGI